MLAANPIITGLLVTNRIIVGHAVGWPRSPYKTVLWPMSAFCFAGESVAFIGTPNAAYCCAAQTLFIATGTVKAHLHNIFQKSGVSQCRELERLLKDALCSFSLQEGTFWI